MQGSTLTAAAYVLSSVAMLVWAWFHLERRDEVTRRVERIQQMVVVFHFVILAGWFLRHRFGFFERGADPTALGTVFELAGAGSSFVIAATSILFNPGVGWNRFFALYGAVALLHGVAFGALALGWPEALGLVPDLEEVIRDREHFGSPDPTNALQNPPSTHGGDTTTTPQNP